VRETRTQKSKTLEFDKKTSITKYFLFQVEGVSKSVKNRHENKIYKTNDIIQAGKAQDKKKFLSPRNYFKIIFENYSTHILKHNFYYRAYILDLSPGNNKFQNRSLKKLSLPPTSELTSKQKTTSCRGSIHN